MHTDHSNRVSSVQIRVRVNTLIFASAALFTATAFGFCIFSFNVVAQTPSEKPKRALKLSLAALEASSTKQQSSNSVNGLKLTLSTKISTKNNKSNVMLQWKIAYYGPRPPLIVLPPSLEEPISTTAVFIYAVPFGANEGYLIYAISPQEYIDYKTSKRIRVDPFGNTMATALPMQFNSPSPFPFNLDTTKWKSRFISVPKGSTASGSITIPCSDLKRELRKSYTDRVCLKKSVRFFAKMLYTPSHRGEGYGLDAWTGEIETPLIAVPGIAKW